MTAKCVLIQLICVSAEFVQLMTCRLVGEIIAHMEETEMQPLFSFHQMAAALVGPVGTQR